MPTGSEGWITALYRRVTISIGKRRAACFRLWRGGGNSVLIDGERVEEFGKHYVTADFLPLLGV